MAAGDALADVLEDLIRALEVQSDVEMLASILILGEDGKRLLLGAAPSLPKTYNEAIHGTQIGPAAGSCGTAAFRGESVFVSDIANDPLWVDHRELALTHGLRACWSTPIKAADGRVLGTFALYYRESRSPSQQDLEEIALIAAPWRLQLSATGLKRRCVKAGNGCLTPLRQPGRLGPGIGAFPPTGSISTHVSRCCCRSTRK
jgi:GAF domain-containing protein